MFTTMNFVRGRGGISPLACGSTTTATVDQKTARHAHYGPTATEPRGAVFTTGSSPHRTNQRRYTCYTMLAWEEGDPAVGFQQITHREPPRLRRYMRTERMEWTDGNALWEFSGRPA